MNSQPNRLSLWKAWIISSRPKTLVVTFGPLTISLAYLSSIDFLAPFPWFRVATIWIGCFILQIACNLTNDYFDFIRGVDDESRVGPKRILQLGIISPEVMAKTIIVLYSLFFGISLIMSATITWWVLPLAMMSMVVAYFYTGGPYPFSYYALGDFFAFLFFGPVLTLIIIYITGFDHIHFDPFIAFLLGLGPGFFSLTLMNINNIRDLEQDKAKGKKTMALFLGREKSLCFMAGYFFLAMLIPTFVADYYQKSNYQILFVFLIPAIFFTGKIFRIQGADFNPLIGFTGMVYLIYTISFSLLWVLDSS